MLFLDRRPAAADNVAALDSDTLVSHFLIMNNKLIGDILGCHPTVSEKDISILFIGNDLAQGFSVQVIGIIALDSRGLRSFT